MPAHNVGLKSVVADLLISCLDIIILFDFTNGLDEFPDIICALSKSFIRFSGRNCFSSGVISQSAFSPRHKSLPAAAHGCSFVYRCISSLNDFLSSLMAL